MIPIGSKVRVRGLLKGLATVLDYQAPDTYIVETSDRRLHVIKGEEVPHASQVRSPKYLRTRRHCSVGRAVLVRLVRLRMRAGHTFAGNCGDLQVSPGYLRELICEAFRPRLAAFRRENP